MVLMQRDGQSAARRRRRGRLLRRTQRGHVGARRRKLGRGTECVVVRVRRVRRPRDAAGTCGAGVLRAAADRLAKRRRQWRRGRRGQRRRRKRQRQIERSGTVVELGSERQAPLPVALRKETAKLGGGGEESTKIKRADNGQKISDKIVQSDACTHFGGRMTTKNTMNSISKSDHKSRTAFATSRRSNARRRASTCA
jgi:hypothetical protein